jgi:F0F1-type ATP synthase assembly protein I
MTKKEREQIHDRLTYKMMENVNRHADVQKMIQEKNKEDSDMVKIAVAFCAGCLVTVAASMLLTMI